MMKNTSPSLRTALVAASAVLLPLTAAGTGGATLPTGEGTAPPRSCTFSVPYPSGGTVQITAGPSATPGQLDAEFPLTVTNQSDGQCPASAGTCLRWHYRWTYTPGVLSPISGANFTFLTLDSDLNLFNVLGNNRWISGPGAAPDWLGVAANVAEVRLVATNPNAANYNVYLYTSGNAQVGKVTAGFRSGLRAGFCAIQGAEKPPFDPLLAAETTVEEVVGGCTFKRTLTPDGCTKSVTVTGQNQAQSCNVFDRDLVINNKVATTASCGTVVAGPFGSTEVCRWNSVLRKTTCYSY